MKVGIAFGAGGARGIAHLLMIEALDELGIKPTIISGSSIGAVVGALADYIVKGIDVSLIVKIIVGILGGVIGSWVFGLLNIAASGLIGELVMALVGAIILLLILRAIRHK